ncbi:unnamed protein product [Lupinus luteus]|uniref:Uncharacterized protein n=1 Tax=Lupinus luteus TaxID=3873 RepID=A0AAV1WA27_LUPLU
MEYRIVELNGPKEHHPCLGVCKLTRMRRMDTFRFPSLILILKRVNAPTSIIVKKQNQADNGDEPYVLNWEWMYEPSGQVKNGKILRNVSMTASQLLDQKVVTNYTSDYFKTMLESSVEW